jgi:hypothetical protein
MSDYLDKVSKSLAAKTVPSRRLVWFLYLAVSGAFVAFGMGPATLDLANLPGDLRAVEVPGPSNLKAFQPSTNIIHKFQRRNSLVSKGDFQVHKW